MSKLGAAPPPPPYKVPLSERLFGIGKLRPPVTDGTSGSDSALPASIKLGDYTLAMDARGQWQMSGALVQLYQNQITQLEAKVAQLEDERLHRNVFELEKANLALERERLAAMDENAQLRFKNKVLMAMCTISEGDYKALCKEAGIEPRSQKKPAPAPVALAPSASPTAAQTLSSPYAQSQQQQHHQQQHPQGSPSNAYDAAPSVLNTSASPMASSYARGSGPTPVGLSVAGTPMAYQQAPQSTSHQQYNNQQSTRSQPQQSPVYGR